MVFCLQTTWPGVKLETKKKIFLPVAEWLFVRQSLLMHWLISFAKCSPVFFLLPLVKIYICQDPLTHAPLLKSFHPLSATLMGFWGQGRAWSMNIKDFSQSCLRCPESMFTHLGLYAFHVGHLSFLPLLLCLSPSLYSHSPVFQNPSHWTP